jgi:hypothetical protein
VPTPRSTVGTATDANAMLRILFSRLGQPHIGPPTAYPFNVPTRKASGSMTVDKVNEGALTIPGYTVDSWVGWIFTASGVLDPDKPIRKYTKKELHDFLHGEPTKVKIEGANQTYMGLVPATSAPRSPTSPMSSTSPPRACTPMTSSG